MQGLQTGNVRKEYPHGEPGVRERDAAGGGSAASTRRSVDAGQTIQPAQRYCCVTHNRPRVARVAQFLFVPLEMS